jgi:predicted RNase H-like HicB family nuclease
MKIKYELIIYWSEIDQSFIVEVPELPGCMADGETYQEAVQNVEIIIQEWLETAQELGRPIPEPKGRLMFAQNPKICPSPSSTARQPERSMPAQPKITLE